MRPFLRRLLLGTVGTLAVASLAGFWAYRAYVVDDPGPQFTREAILAVIAQESPVYFRDGATRIGVFFDVEHRAYVPYDEIPKDWVNAIVASEDGTFFEHAGLSPKHIARAAWQNLRAGGVVAGGSTLTQQTAKNLFYRPDRSFRSKGVEFVNALRLEAHFSKEDILEFYANQFHVSANGRGLGIAARYFFDKTPRELSLKECAFIAGLVKAPSRYNPFLGDSEERRAKARAAAEDRTAYVLRRMVEEGTLPAGELDALLAEPLQFRRGDFQYDRSVLLDEVQRRLEAPAFIELFERLGIDNPSTAGIQVITTVDARVQTGSVYALWHHLSEIGPVVDRSRPSALRLREGTTVPVPAGNTLALREFYTARVASASARRVELDVGGLPCVVPEDGVDRMAAVFARAAAGRMDVPVGEAARAALVEALPVGSVVLVSVRDAAAGAPVCDLEVRPRLQGAAIVLEDGVIRGMVGGNDNRNFNRALTAGRQFGSTWKPLVYAAALQLGWLPEDLLDNRRGVFPFRGVFYYPRADHASDAWVSMSMSGARSENLASVWILAHLVDRLNPEQLRRLATLVGLAQSDGETREAWIARLRDTEGLRASPDRLEELAFTQAREDVLSGMAFSAHPEDAAPLRSLHHGRGFAAERARLLRTADSPERRARLSALDQSLLSMEEALRVCRTAEADARFCGARGAAEAAADVPVEDATVPEPAALVEPPPADPLVHGTLHASTIVALRAALDRRVAEFAGKDPWDPELLALDPDYRALVGIRYVQRLVAALGVETELPTGLSLPLGVADITLADAATLYASFLKGERWTSQGQGFEEGAVQGLRSAFDLPSDGAGAALIAEIRDAAGNVIYRARSAAEPVSDPVSGALVGDILRNVVRVGTGRRAAAPVAGIPLPLAGKTGTTNDYRNAAFLGFVPRPVDGGYRWGDAFTVGVYVGYDDNTAMKRGGARIQGANGALPAWLGIARTLVEAGLAAPQGTAVASEYAVPEGLVRVPLAAAQDAPSALTAAGGARRFAPFSEPAAAAAPAAPIAPPLPAEGPGADLGPDAVEEGVEDAAVVPASEVPPSEAPPSVWDGL